MLAVSAPARLHTVMPFNGLLIMDCRLIHFSGRVQGVGFRDTTWRLAQSFPVAGTVRNLSDGRVELLIQGATVELDRFLDSLRSKMRDFIESVTVENIAVREELAGFRIVS